MKIQIQTIVTLFFFLIGAIVATIATALYLQFYYKPQQQQPACPIQTCPTCPACPACPIQQQYPKQQQQNRDVRVLSDPLYPPLNRSNAGPPDSYRLIGVLSSTDQEKDAGNNQWKLFGRMKDRNQGEYYISPANNNIDLKIALTPEMTRGERLRDVYSLPTEMSFSSPMLNTTPYILSEMPKSDFSNDLYF